MIRVTIGTQDTHGKWGPTWRWETNIKTRDIEENWNIYKD